MRVSVTALIIKAHPPSPTERPTIRAVWSELVVSDGSGGGAGGAGGGDGGLGGGDGG